MNRWVVATFIAALFIAGLFGPPGATSADAWDLNINGGIAQLLPLGAARSDEKNACAEQCLEVITKWV
jgi:hypothetical protein